MGKRDLEGASAVEQGEALGFGGKGIPELKHGAK